MPILFDDARVTPRARGRSTTGLWVSVGLHVIVAIVLIAMPMRASEKPPAPRLRSMRVFLEPVTLPAAPIVAMRLPAPPPPPMRELPEAPKPLPLAPPVARAIEPLAPIAPAPAPEPPVQKPVIQRAPETGLFERATAARTTQADTAVAPGGFGSVAASPRGAASDSVVTTGGFGSGARAPRTAGAAGEVQAAAFDRRASAPVQPAVAVPDGSIDRPVEIVFKPTPEYTDDARSARIEGTVSLELEFTAAGDVRVLRVVRGLGYGLDEAAERAARRIRFKPAQSGDRPVDARATVHITFRLS
jgi:TonB family protein